MTGRRAGPAGAVVWTAAALLVTGLGRQIAYALAGGGLAERLSASAGGPDLAIVAAVALAVAGAGSAIGLWLVAMGVRERCELELDGWARPLRPVRPRDVARRTAVLSIATTGAFTSLESWLHYRAGLGFHGLHCIAGPVHRNALPILVALSLVVSAAVSAAELLLSAARRVVARMVALRRPGRVRSGRVRRPTSSRPRCHRRQSANLTRGPPLPA